MCEAITTHTTSDSTATTQAYLFRRHLLCRRFLLLCNRSESVLQYVQLALHRMTFLTDWRFN